MPDKEALGRAYWLTLQSFPSSMHDPPAEAERQAFLNFLEASSVLYACETCRSGFEWIRANPPDFSSKRSLNRWICDFHNSVNEHLGKPHFDCSVLVMPSRPCPSCTVNLPKKKKAEFIQLLF
jgi:FAD-linked sulfhydryl oxidase